VDTIRDLRRRWKPHKARLTAQRANHPTPIRFHRACSWLDRVEKLEEADADLALVSQWIAFNSLYGQWDTNIGHAVADRECWRVFLERILEIDLAGYVREVLESQKALVLSLMEDQYLSELFWHDPGQEKGRRARRTKLEAQKWYVEDKWQLILEHVFERIYLLRCQLIHGAATFGGKLNRRSLRRCSVMMGHALTAILSVWIDFGADEDWGIICYPPVHPGDAALS
jgi:hypothetical protein